MASAKLYIAVLVLVISLFTPSYQSEVNENEEDLGIEQLILTSTFNLTTKFNLTLKFNLTSNLPQVQSLLQQKIELLKNETKVRIQPNVIRRLVRLVVLLQRLQKLQQQLGIELEYVEVLNVTNATIGNASNLLKDQIQDLKNVTELLTGGEKDEKESRQIIRSLNLIRRALERVLRNLIRLDINARGNGRGLGRGRALGQGRKNVEENNERMGRGRSNERGNRNERNEEKVKTKKDE